jgi:hypothetical protein
MVKNKLGVSEHFELGHALSQEGKQEIPVITPLSNPATGLEHNYNRTNPQSWNFEPSSPHSLKTQNSTIRKLSRHQSVR